MKAAVWYGKKDVRVEERTLKNLKENELKVKVAWTGICGSDLHEYIDGPIFIPVDKPDPRTKDKAPITLGHEFSGIVEEVGANVSELRKGDRVAVYPMITNGKKPANEDLYDGFSTIGLTTDGGFADYAIVTEDKLYKLPDSMSLEKGALIEPTAVAVQALKETNLTIGDSVAVFGAGPIGLLTIMAAKAAGATNIISLDLSASRLEMAKKVGATYAINTAEQDAIKAIKEICPDGVDIAFEVAGVEITYKQAIKATKIRGMVMIIAIFSQSINWEPMDLTTSAIRVGATLCYEKETFQQTIQLINEGQIKAETIVTDRIQLNDIVSKGFEVLNNDKNQSKILVELSGK